MHTSNDIIGRLASSALFGPPAERGAAMLEVEQVASTIIGDCEAQIAEVYRSSLSTSSGVVLRNSAAFRRLRSVCEVPSTIYPLMGLLCAFVQTPDGDVTSPPTPTPWCGVLIQAAGRLCMGGTTNDVVPTPVSYDACAGMHRAIVQLLCNGLLVYQCGGPLGEGIAAVEGTHPPMYALLMALCECLGDHHPSAPRIGQLVRTLAKLPAVCKAAFYTHTDEGYTSSVICRLLRGSAHTTSTSQLAENSGCLGTFFIRAKEMASAFVLTYFEMYVMDLQSALRVGGDGGGEYVSSRLCLKLLSFVLGDGGFGKARTRLADCPALLAAVLGVVGEVRLSAHPASPRGGAVTGDALLMYDAYHVLKVFIAKPKKNLPVRYILSTNRDAVIHFINTYHVCCPQLEGGKGREEGYEEEHNLLVGRVMTIDPLTSDELLELDLLLTETC